MWGDVPRSKPSNGGGFGLFQQKKQKPQGDDGVARTEHHEAAAVQRSAESSVGRRRKAGDRGQEPAGRVVQRRHGAGSVVVDQSQRKLYYVLGDGKAYAYPVAVGKKGFKWTGSQKVSGIKSWPDWVPPEEMRQRKPYLCRLR